MNPLVQKFIEFVAVFFILSLLFGAVLLIAMTLYFWPILLVPTLLIVVGVAAWIIVDSMN